MELEKLKKRIAETIEMYNNLIEADHALIETFQTRKKRAEGLGDEIATLDFEKNIIYVRAGMLARISAKSLLEQLLK